MDGTAAGRYSQLEGDRRPYLDRGRQCAALTIPTLLPAEGSNNATKFVTPFQSVGARGVNNICSKLLLTLFPPNTAYFKMSLDELTRQQVTGRPGMQAEVDKGLTAYVGRVMSEVESRNVRVAAFEGFKHTVVSGNACLYFPDEGGMRVYRLDKYVCKRDPAGTLLELIIKEQIAFEAIPVAIRAKLPIEDAQKPAPSQGTNGKVDPPTEQSQKVYDLYTRVYLSDDTYTVYQEVADTLVDGSIGTYPKDRCPYIPLRFIKVDGEDYGRSYVEEYLGDIAALEDLSKAILQYSAVASRVVIFVDPSGTTKKKDVSKAKTGDVLTGNADKDVTTLKLDNYYDLKVAQQMAETIEQRLAFAFLLNTAIQRPGERVTAEEIRYMARELEDTLGGVYSVQSQELQIPLTRVIIAQLERAGQLPELPKGVNPTLVTGLDALGRGQDLAKLDEFINGALQKNPQFVAQAINWSDYLTRRAAALGIDANGLIKTPEEIAQANQQAQMQAMIEKLGPNAVNALGGVTQKAMDSGNQAGPAAPQG